jgi:gluconokinase
VTVVLALDFGSSFLKAQRFDETGSPVGPSARQPAHIGPDGTADVDEVAATAEALLDAVLSGRPEPAAVAVSSGWHTLAGTDESGRATTELSTWMDGRASAEAAALRAAVADAAEVHDRVGAPIHPSFPSARILWAARHRPDAFAATTRWCSLSEFLLSRWFGGRVGPSSSIASASGLSDQRSKAWHDEVLNAIGLAPERLAAVDDEPRAGLAPAYRKRWPAIAKVPWYPALGDGACSALGVGVRAGRAALTVGTSAAVRVVTARTKRFAAPLPFALFGYLADTETSVVGAARSNAGAAVDWAAGVLGVNTGDVVRDATAGRAPGGHGLRVDPSLIVERSPSWPLTASAGVEGIRRTTSSLDILQAFVEAVAIGIADAADALDEWAGPQSLVLSGGASSVDGWRRLLADALGRPLARSVVSDESARGAALAAFARMGSSMPPPPSDEPAVKPDPARSAAFAEVRAARAEPPFAASLGL